MIYFTLNIIIGLFDSSISYEERKPHMDEYSFSGESIAEISAKVRNVLGDDRSWAETASIDLYYNSTACKCFLTKWDNVGGVNKTKLVNLIYGA